MRSGFEVKVAADLKKRGIAYEYEPESFIYTVERRYIPDFKVKGRGGPCFLEIKGYLTPADRAKTLRVLSAHPELDLRFVFQRASNRLNKTSKTTYGDWATRHGIPWCEGTPPKSWFAAVP